MDAESKRDMYLKMFVNQPEAPSNRTGDADSDLNERVFVDNIDSTLNSRVPGNDNTFGGGLLSDYNYSNTMNTTKANNRSLAPPKAGK